MLRGRRPSAPSGVPLASALQGTYRGRPRVGVLEVANELLWRVRTPEGRPSLTRAWGRRPPWLRRPGARTARAVEPGRAAPPLLRAIDQPPKRTPSALRSAASSGSDGARRESRWGLERPQSGGSAARRSGRRAPPPSAASTARTQTPRCPRAWPEPALVPSPTARPPPGGSRRPARTRTPWRGWVRRCTRRRTARRPGGSASAGGPSAPRPPGPSWAGRNGNARPAGSGCRQRRRACTGCRTRPGARFPAPRSHARPPAHLRPRPGG